MTSKIVSLSLSLLLAGALVVLAQSPTTSAPPGAGATHDPYGATMDHPNPSSATAGNTVTTTTQSNGTSATTGSNANNTDNSSTPTATGTASSSTMPSTDTTTTTTTSTDNSANTTPSSLPKTASDLPLFAALGFMALAGACVMRAAARQRG